MAVTVAVTKLVTRAVSESVRSGVTTGVTMPVRRVVSRPVTETVTKGVTGPVVPRTMEDGGWRMEERPVVSELASSVMFGAFPVSNPVKAKMEVSMDSDREQFAARSRSL
jgi:hypothetical protein